MSIETWKKEFYPVEANEVNKKDAIQHSLTKWLGLTKKNLEKHGLRSHCSCLLAKEPCSYKVLFVVDDCSCALCHYYNMDEDTDVKPCKNCPLVKNHFVSSNGCGRGDEDDIYCQFSEIDNPLPMIKALKFCLNKKH